MLTMIVTFFFGGCKCLRSRHEKWNDPVAPCQHNKMQERLESCKCLSMEPEQERQGSAVRTVDLLENGLVTLAMSVLWLVLEVGSGVLFLISRSAAETEAIFQWFYFICLPTASVCASMWKEVAAGMMVPALALFVFYYTFMFSLVSM